jgi:hypothetical protein
MHQSTHAPKIGEFHNHFRRRNGNPPPSQASQTQPSLALRIFLSVRGQERLAGSISSPASPFAQLDPWNWGRLAAI